MSKYKFEDEGRKHVHMLDREDGMGYKPLKGTTTIINEVYPPPLAWYGSAQALGYFGWLKPKEKVDGKYVSFPVEKRLEAIGEAIKTLKPLLDDPAKALEEFDNAYKAHDEYKKSKGKEGTDTHTLIEEYISACIKQNEGKPLEKSVHEQVQSFANWAMKDVGKFLHCEAYCYSEKLWIGGKFDMVFRHKNGKIIIGDNKPNVYPKHFIQTAGYGLQIKENGIFMADGTIIGALKDIDGYCIIGYNDNKVNYLSGEWVKDLEADFIHTVKQHDRLDLVGSPTLG